MDQQSGGSTDEARGDDTIAKGKKTALAFVLADSSAWVKDKVAENKELDLYLSSNEDDEFSISSPSLDELFENKTNEADVSRKNKDIGLFYATRPLVYWNRYSPKYRLLSQFARKRLGVSSTTSVASERLFSRAKAFIKTDRARLEPETAGKYGLLNCCYREEFNQTK